MSEEKDYPWEKYTKEQKAWLNEHYIGRSNKELTEMFNKRFSTNFTLMQIRTYKTTRKLKSGTQGKLPENLKNLRDFKVKKVPIYSENKSSDGYTYIKIAEPNTWVKKHRWVYEQAYGPIPKGCAIVFLDGNKDNFSLDNLLCVKRKVQMRNAREGRNSTDPALTKVGLAITSAELKIKELEGGKNENSKN